MGEDQRYDEYVELVEKAHKMELLTLTGVCIDTEY